MNSCLICALANQEIPDMKRLFLLAFIAFSLQGYACDICGCSGSTNYLGILPLVQQNLAGFRFQYTGFTHPNTDENFNGQSRVFQTGITTQRPGFAFTQLSAGRCLPLFPTNGMCEPRASAPRPFRV
jgi:hypothetical protein